MDTVWIHDLAKPEFSPQMQKILDSMGGRAPACVFEVDALLEAASKQADGLTDFGDPWFREPLGVLCDALNNEVALSPQGRVSLFMQFVTLLKNRLRMEDLLRRHPEIHDVPVEQPVIITGFFRTGSTHLHNTLAANPALRYLPMWEAFEPVPPPGETAKDTAPRIDRMAKSLGFLHTAMPFYKRMLDCTPTYAHEELNLLAMSFSSMYFEVLVTAPSFREWYLSHDQTPAYAYLKKSMQVMTWLRGGERWLLKCPQHLEQLRPLMNVFPDASVVFTHRDPVAVIASMATMMCYTQRMTSPSPDPAEVGRYWASRIGNMADGCLRDRAAVPAAHSLDVLFDDFMADEAGTVRRIYEMAGQPYTPEAQKVTEEYLASHGRSRHGRLEYRLSDFGLDAAELRAMVSSYTARFGVREVTIR